MKSATQERLTLTGAAGKLETLVNDPGQSRRGIAVIAHPHPLFGGTLENKVVQTLAKAFVELGYVAVRPNFRGVGQSEGAHDEGRGEVEDLVHVVEWTRAEYGDLPLILAGFSFGGFVQLRVSRRVPHRKLVLIAPAVGRLDPAIGNFHDDGDVPPGTLIVHGDEDDVVPLQSVIDWAKPRQLPIILLPGAGHFFHGRLSQLKDVVQQACAEVASK
ncbi:MAG TPA: alpha/beta fold hydrolase [Burkholderiales bacterium]|nr:alpha/beta fold hydrolase [Burkholderiales bacterium]